MSATLKDVHLHYPNGQKPAKLAQECDMALADLALSGHFQPVNDKNGPYRLDISVEEHRLVLKIQNADGAALPMLILSLSPYKRIIYDYFLMIESYERMRVEGNLQKLEPIDMARRGLHNEAADMMRERLKDKIEIDHDTARRLFTLVCALATK